MQERKRKQSLLKKEKEIDDKSEVKKFLSRDKSEAGKTVKHKKKKRLIIRNLSFQVTNEELREKFSKFGKVVDVNIPLKDDGRKRGFAFVEFDETKSLIKAMKALNQKEIHGRRVAIDFAIDKTNYQLKLQNIKQEKDISPEKDKKIIPVTDDESDEEKPDINSLDESIGDLDENEKRANDFLREFDSGFETVQNDDDDSSDECSSDNESDKDESEKEEGEKSSFLSEESDVLDNRIENKSNDSSKEKLNKKRNSQDVSEGKTVFIRNVSFTTTKEDLREAMEKHGDCEYCVICIDPLTDHSRGSAFVKFKLKDSADNLVQESMRDPGILIDGRKLNCSLAVSKEVISEHKNDLKKPKDKRNLSLLKVGLIMPNSAESEGVSPSDMAKRYQLEILKKQKLKNVNFFVSDVRLMVHNLPKTFTDVKLRKLFKDAAGKGAVITEARVMRDFKKTSVAGIPLSKGFGFVSFSKHEDAIKALMELNNNPNTFISQKRPIVEFSVENRVALLSKERKKEKMKLRNQRRTEEKQERLSTQTAKNNEKNTSEVKKSSKKVKRKKQGNVNSDKMEENIDSSFATDSPSKKRRKRKKRNNIVTEKNDGDNSCIVENIQTSKANNSDKKKKTKGTKKSQKKTENIRNDNFSETNFKSMVENFKEKLMNKT